MVKRGFAQGDLLVAWLWHEVILTKFPCALSLVAKMLKSSQKVDVHDECMKNGFIKVKELAPGDILVWRGHVAIYAGKGMIYTTSDKYSDFRAV